MRVGLSKRAGRLVSLVWQGRSRAAARAVEMLVTGPSKKPLSYADARRIANQAAKAYRAAHPSALKPGLQAQHWFKVKEASAAKLPPKTMNSNISLLQSHGDKPANTLLTSPNGKGTTYTAGKSSYTAEHRFADNHLFPAEKQRMLQSGVKEGKAVQAAGATTRWKMEGQTGPVDPKIIRTVNLAKGEKLKASPGARAASEPAKPASSPVRSLARGAKLPASPASPKLVKPPSGPAPSGPAAGSSVPKMAPSGPQGGPAGNGSGSLGSIIKPGGSGGL